MESLIRDVRHSLRTLRRAPVLSLAAVLSLALGIGANTAIFSLVHPLLLDPLPVPQADRLVGVFTVDRDQAEALGSAELPTSHPNFLDFREGADNLSHLVAVLGAPVALSGDGPAERIPSQIVSAGYFDMMRIKPALGRFFLPEENRDRGRAPVAVISHDLWQSRFGGDADVLGRTLRLNSSPFEIVGVAPRGFKGTGLFTPDLWLPMTMHRQLVTGPVLGFFDNRRALMLDLLGRLRDGVSVQQAEQELAAIAQRLAERYPQANEGRGVAVMPLAEANVPPDLRGLFVRVGGLLMAVVGLVLLVACANVVNLLLARSQARRGDVAMRMALGAPRGRQLRQMLIDGLLLAFLGAGVGLLVARWTRDLLWGLRPPLLATADPDLAFDSTVLAVTGLLAVVTGLLFSFAPAVQLLRLDLVSAIQSRKTAAVGGNRPWRLRNLLVVGQVALSLVAIVGCGLFLANIERLEEVDPGFDADRLAALSFNLGASGYTPPQMESFRRRALEAVRALPSVESAALATNRPLSPFGGVRRTLLPEGGAPPDVPDEGLAVPTDAVSHEYFRTLGVPIVDGRPFAAQDRRDSRPVAVVSEALARRMWPDGDAVGKRFTLSGIPARYQVVGVAEDRKVNSVGESPQPYLHLLLDQSPVPFAQLFVRTPGDPAAALEAARGAVQELDPELPLTDLATMSSTVDESLWASRLGATLLGAFGGLALLLAAIGLYGVIAYSLLQRQRELAMRMAVGADRRELVKLVLRQGMLLTGVGLAVGLVLALLVARSGVFGALLHGASATDPLVFLGASLLLLAVALVANLLPVGRATGVEPALTLRSE